MKSPWKQDVEYKLDVKCQTQQMLNCSKLAALYFFKVCYSQFQVSTFAGIITMITDMHGVVLQTYLHNFLESLQRKKMN